MNRTKPLLFNSSFRFPEQLALFIGQLWRMTQDFLGSSITTVKSFTSWTTQARLFLHPSHCCDITIQFFAEAEQIGSPDYILGEMDILRCQQSPTEIGEPLSDEQPVVPYMPP